MLVGKYPVLRAAILDATELSAAGYALVDTIAVGIDVGPEPRLEAAAQRGDGCCG